MNFIWEKKHETGIEKFDSQHKKFFELFNVLFNKCVIKKDTSTVKETILELKLYTIFHFPVEEKLYKRYNYTQSEYDEQIKEHETFVSKIAGFLADTTSSQYELGCRISDFLTAWIVEHILTIDMKFISFLKKKHFTEISLDEDITYKVDDFE